LAAGKTLISFKSGKRVAISNKNAYRYRKGEKPVQITLTPRGFLHKEKVYGKILRYEEVKLSPRFNRFGDIAFSSSKIFLSGFLTQYNNDIKKAFSVKGIKKLMNQMNGKSIQGLEIGESAVWVTVFKPEFVISYPLKELKAKDVKFVIDKKVRDILLKRIENYGEKEAFKDIHNDPVWFNEEKKIPIKSSRIISGYDDLIPLHSTNKGFTFSRKSTVDQAIPVDYVVPRNNHHIAIYRDEKGNLQENVVTLMDALTRKHAGIPVVIKNPKSVWDYILEKQIDINDELKNLPEDSWRFVTSMQQNEMFIFDMDAEAINNAIERNDYLILSQHLYRVQKLTSKYYSFRHHLETQVDDKKIGGEKVSILLGRYKRITDMKKMTGIKVKVNRLGKIEKIGE
jgi:CRISPR-associated endonuclease Csn1